MNKSKFKILLSISFIIIVISGFLLYKIFKPVQSLEKINPDYILTSDKLLDDFNSNEEKASQKYVGKIILVKGNIEEIIQNENQTIITIRTNDPFSTISCKLSNKEKLESNLKTGQSISIKGECSGMLMDIILINCTIITEE